MIAGILFWWSLFFVFYAYFGYPLLLVVLGMLRKRSVLKQQFSPKVSFVIAAYNEQAAIRKKIENTLAQNYPAGRLEIIVSSDCSTDSTDEIAMSYASRGVLFVSTSERRGKESAQKAAVAVSTGDILVFSDVAAQLNTDGVTRIVNNFSDATVGCVSSIDCFIDKDGRISGEGAYVRYEMWLRQLESDVNSLVGLSGSFFAARKELCNDWVTDLDSDFNTLLQAVKSGLRGVLDCESVGIYENISNENREIERKIRTVLRGISAFMRNLDLLNPFRYGLFSWQLFSHKLCRWLVPFALVILLASNIALAGVSGVYFLTLMIQIWFYLFAYIGLRSAVLPRGLLKIPVFFIVVNCSILIAWYRYFKGERIVIWNPSERDS